MNLKWPSGRYLCSVSNSLNFSGDFTSCGFFLFHKHPFMNRSVFLSRLPPFLRVLSKIGYICKIKNGESKMADGSRSHFNHK